jgi:hypothetical protein
VALDPKVRGALLTWRKTHFFLGKAKSARKVRETCGRYLGVLIPRLEPLDALIPYPASVFP